ncbi:MAG: DNA primase [Dehalococcoidales bacterium]|nr:DNA primase [Dehalococcoidales bacterium]
MSAIDEVKQRTDIVAVISQYTALKKAGRNLTGLCPFHSEKHASFFVFPEQQSWHCFGACATGGDVLSFIMKKEGLTFGEALRLLADKAGVALPEKPGQAEKKEEQAELYQINQAAAEYYHNLLLTSPAAEKARKYIAGRGLIPQTISDFQLGYSPDSWESLKQHLMQIGYSENSLLKCGIIIEAENGKTHDRFRGRLMFPIRDAKGRTVGFGGRALDDAMPKYMNSSQSPVFDKSSILYGIDRAARAIREKDRAVIVEGYMDVIMAHQYGINNVVASMGTSITETQVLTLKKLSRNMVLALDSDTAGEEAMLRGVGYENTLGAEVRVVRLPEGKDPDEVIKEDIKSWEQLVEQALPIMDYTINMITAKLDLSQPGDKSRAVEQLVPSIAAMEDGVRQSHYMQKLARLVSVSPHVIETTMKKLVTAARKRPTINKEAVELTIPVEVTDTLEEYCLALLLQHPELKERCAGFSVDCFANSANREIFTAWLECDDRLILKDKLDQNIHERLDALMKKEIPATQLEKKIGASLLRLREKYLRSLESRRSELLAQEVEAGGAGADLAVLEEQGIETSIQLGEVQKQQRWSETRR